MRLGVLLLPLLLAGCAAPEAAAPPADAPAPRAVPVTLADCLVVEALATAPAEAVRAHVPEQFDVDAQEAGRVAVALGGFACADGNASGIFAIAVRPRNASLLDDAVDRYFWRPEVYAPADAAFSHTYAGVRGAARPAAIRADAGPAFGAFDIEPEEGDAHRITFGGAPVAPEGGRFTSGVFREYGAAEGGFAYLQATFVPPSGPGFALLPARGVTGADTPARAVLGETFASYAFVLRGADYGEAAVGFVPHAP